MALKLLMTKKEQIQTEERCRYIIIDPKSSDDEVNIRRINSQKDIKRKSTIKRAWTTEAMHNLENNSEDGNEDELV